MTIEEVSKEFHYSISSLTSNFKRCSDKIYEKTGVRIVKDGRGKNATYRILVLDDNRAETFTKEEEIQTGLIKEDLKLVSMTFVTFMGIITTPMLAFRGSYVDFLKYIELPPAEENIEQLKKSIKELEQKKMIYSIVDNSTDEEIITLSVVRKAELDMKIGISTVKTCKQLAKDNNKRDWIPLLKLWLGTELLSKEGIFTRNELKELTGLNDYQIQTCGKILRQNNIYRSSRAYVGLNRCIGTTATMNVEQMYDA